MQSTALSNVLQADGQVRTMADHICGLDCGWGCILEPTKPLLELHDTMKRIAEEAPLLEAGDEIVDRLLGDIKFSTPFAEKVLALTDEIATLLVDKNASYGDAALDPIRIFSDQDAEAGLRLRIDDKLSRIARGTEYQGEDTVLDLIGYLLLLLIELRGGIE